MDNDIARECRFYTLVIIGAALMFTAIWMPPIGIISTSVLWGSGITFSLAGLLEGVDLKGIIRELRLLKECPNPNEQSKRIDKLSKEGE